MYSNQKQKTKTYIAPASMSLHVLKSKTENKYVTQDYMIGTGKNVKAVYKLKKNQQSKSKFFTFLFDGTYSVSQFLYFY